MLYDILLALFGHSGGDIVECVEMGGSFKLAENVTLSLHEKDAISSILETASLYKSLKRFCEDTKECLYHSCLDEIFDQNSELDQFSSSREYKTSNVVTKNKGYYLTALCNEIENFLKSYRKQLLSLEKLIASEEPLPLMTFSVLLKDQNDIFHALNRVIVEYENLCRKYQGEDMFSKSKGLLEILQEDQNDQVCEKVFRKLRTGVFNFLKIQLKSWMCQGHLTDPYGEFLISYRDVDNVDPNLQFPLNTNYRDEGETGLENYDSKLMEFEWNYKFYIKLDKSSNLGPINYETSKNILSIGKVVRLLQRASKVSTEDLIERAEEYLFSRWEEITADEEKFSEAIERYGSYVSSLFWTLENERFNILDRLELFKNVYFMSNESLYEDLLGDVHQIMDQKYNDNLFKIVKNKFTARLAKMLESPGHRNKFESVNKTKTLEVEEKAEEVLKRELEEEIKEKMEKEETERFEMIKYVDNFNIKSNFIKMNSIKNKDGNIEVGKDSSLWFEEPIYIFETFNVNTLINLNKVLSSKRVSVLMASNYFKSFNRGNDKEEERKGEYLSINFEFFKMKEECIKLVIEVMYKNVYNNNKIGNKEIIIGSQEKLVKYHRNSELKVKVDLKFDKNSLKVNVRPLNYKDQEFTRYYSMEKSGKGEYEVEQWSYEDDEEGEQDEEDHEDEYLNCKHIIRKGSATNSKEIGREEYREGEGNEISMNINAIDIIEMLKLIANPVYIGIMNHDTKDSPQETSEVLEKEKERKEDPPVNGIDKLENEKKEERQKEEEDEQEEIVLMEWDYRSNSSKYDLTNYFKVKSESEIYRSKRVPYQDEEEEETTDSEHEDKSPIEIEKYEEVAPNQWMSIMLYYRFKRFNFADIKSYNNMFQILFTIKRCLYGLEMKSDLEGTVRALLTENDRKGTEDERTKLIRYLYGLKYYFQNNLKMILNYFYIQIIEPGYEELTDFVKSSEDFQEIQNKHNKYLSKILRKCIINQHVIYSLFECLDITFKFTSLFRSIKGFSNLSSREVDDTTKSLDKMKENYGDHFSTLTTNFKLY